MKNTRLTCWEIPAERIAILRWTRAVDPDGWRGLWARFVRAAGWIIVTGFLVTSWTTTSPATGAVITTCVYSTPYGEVQIVVRGAFCAHSRRIDIE